MNDRERLLAAVADTHYEWSVANADATPVPERDGSPDVGLHHVDATADAELADDFRRRLEERL